jgi:hypothetical protein
MLSEYRRRFIDYRSTSTETDFLYRSGARRGSERFAIFREHRDLFALETIRNQRDFQASRESGEVLSVTERAGSRRLLGFAIDGYLTSVALEIDEELERQATDRRVSAAPGLLDDLYGERLRLLAQAAQRLGYADLLQLRTEIDGVDYAAMVAPAARLLEQTERVAARGLATLLRRERKLPLAQATRADLAAVEMAGESGSALRFETRLARYSDLFAGLGFRTDQQPGLELCRLPDYCSGPTDLPDHGPDVWAIRQPGRICLGYRALNGRFAERTFWQAAGAAQMAAWTSSSLPPEFQAPAVAGDQAIPLAWGMLFERLLGERQWLKIPFGYAATTHFRTGVIVLRLLELRLAAARLLYEVEYLKGQVTTRANDRYRELLGLALLISVTPPDSDDYRRGIGRLRGIAVTQATTHFGVHPLGSASLLRAAVFESHCREHLRSLCGADWWNFRRAGDTLIDIWNTGYRHSLDQLAQMIGFGPLDFQWLIEELLRENNEQ